MFSGSELVGREMNADLGAAAGLAANFEAAAIEFRERFGDRQTKPRTLLRRRHIGADLAERRQRLGDVGGGDADAGILDPDFDAVAATLLLT